MNASSVSAYGSLTSRIGSAINTVYSARYASAVSKYNQSIYNIQAGVIEANQKYEKERYAKLRKQYMSKGIVTISAQGVGMGRTSLSLLNKSMENLYLDEAVSDYNARMNAISERAQGTAEGITGRSQTAAMYYQAGSTFAKGLGEFASYKRQQEV